CGEIFLDDGSEDGLRRAITNGQFESSLWGDEIGKTVSQALLKPQDAGAKQCAWTWAKQLTLCLVQKRNQVINLAIGPEVLVLFAHINGTRIYSNGRTAALYSIQLRLLQAQSFFRRSGR